MTVVDRSTDERQPFKALTLTSKWSNKWSYACY